MMFDTSDRTDARIATHPDAGSGDPAGRSAALQGRVPSLLRESLVVVYAVAVVGAALQIAGGFWDVSWHVLGIVETFFTPPHTVLYTGIALALAASFVGLVMRVSVFADDPARRQLLGGLHVALAGGVLQAIAGPMDYWWHDTFGFDPFLFTPSHALLITGIILVGVGAALGSVRLLHAHRAGAPLGRFLTSGRWLRAQAVVAFAVLWLVLNSAVDLLTDVDGIAYTFGLDAGFVDRAEPIAFWIAVPALTLTGTLALLSAHRLIGRWAPTGVAVVAASIAATANIGFRAWMDRGTSDGASLALFLPLYFAFLVPVALFDRSLRPDRGRRARIAAAVLVSPFAMYLNGWYGPALWGSGLAGLGITLPAILLGGLLAGILSGRFAAVLVPRRVLAAAIA